MIDHLGFAVRDVAKSRAFYVTALAPIGYGIIMDFTVPDGGAHVGFGKGGKPDFWIGDGEPLTGGHVHVAFAAENRAAVDAFYAAAIAAGGTDNGPPGLRPHYHPDYYGAFVLDPDGHNIEAVCHKPE